MTALNKKYDVAIIGGGLAGLSLSILLAKKNYKVALIEKEKYPFHKVCGEYISMESWNFLEQLGLPLRSMNLPIIDTLKLTAPNGKAFTTKLPLGGFGISRYKIDSLLAQIAKQNGVCLLEETKVEDVSLADNRFYLQLWSKEGKLEIGSAICCGTYGKRSNLDVKWKRDFISKSNPRVNNYLAVKYHIETEWPKNVIGLHNFADGYCGISRIEENKYCLCYLTTADNLKKNANSIEEMQQKVLFKNPALKNIFLNSKFFFQAPLTISQISFDKKTLSEKEILMIGDAAGLITPLCGNGMSMALHASKIASNYIDCFLKNEIDLQRLKSLYGADWRNAFEKRTKTGRILQSFFGSPVLSNLFVSSFKLFPFLADGIIRRTHGQSF